MGLLPALYTSRRKVWVRADPDGEGAVLKVGGLALQRKPQFEEEFAKLVEAMTMRRAGRRRAGPPRRRRPRPEPGAREKVPTR